MKFSSKGTLAVVAAVTAAVVGAIGISTASADDRHGDTEAVAEASGSRLTPEEQRQVEEGRAALDNLYEKGSDILIEFENGTSGWVNFKEQTDHWEETLERIVVFRAENPGISDEAFDSQAVSGAFLVLAQIEVRRSENGPTIGYLSPDGPIDPVRYSSVRAEAENVLRDAGIPFE